MDSSRSSVVFPHARGQARPSSTFPGGRWGTLRRVLALRPVSRGLRAALLLAASWLAGNATVPGSAAEPVQAEVKSATVEGRLDGDAARLVIQANLGNLGGTREPALWSATIHHRMDAARDRLDHRFDLKTEAIRGGLRELILPLRGEGEIRSVRGEGLEDWSVRRDGNGGRSLVLRVRAGDAPVTAFAAVVTAETPLPKLPLQVNALAVTTEQPALAQGYLRLEAAPGLALELVSPSGLVPIEPAFLPEGLRPAAGAEEARVRAFRFHGSDYTLPARVSPADPEAGQVVVRGFRLVGDLSPDTAAFVLEATAQVRDPDGGRLEVLAGGVALTEPAGGEGWTLAHEDGRYTARFDRPGDFPLTLRFHAAVRASNEWNRIDFRVAAGAVAPVIFRGLGPETTLELSGAGRPERVGEEFVSHLSAGGVVRGSWRQARPDMEGRLFYAAEAVSQIAVSPGLLRQSTQVDLKVLQGEMSRLVLALSGEGEVTRVQGAQVLAWALEDPAGNGGRRLSIQFNQPLRDAASLQIQLQRPLGAFPQSFEAPQVVPEGATRFGGHVRVVNEGAVRLETIEATGLSQISPDQFVRTEATQAWLPPQATQVFAYRFAGAGFRLRVQADNILPELGVSKVLSYHLGETELVIEAEIEVDVREAPLRELSLRVPKGYGLARLNASGLSDHFLSEPEGQADALLRLVYGAPVTGRQVVQLRLERNQPLAEPRWTLPRIEVVQAKSVRGHVGVTADPGFRLTPAEVSGLTELAPSFFPKRLAGLQAAFRLTDPAWQATITVERLAQSVQADAFHLFSVGEGIAYGSSVLNYVVSGAPISTLQLELSAEYFNVEFTGKNVRNWQKTERGFQVQLHTPVAGAYTLLATYERPFRAQGETLSFAGARPLDAQTEQGYTLVVSAYQFDVRPANVSSSLTPLETGEVPAEYRLFFDAPILAAYRYSARPFNLQLELRPLAQAEVINQVVDRAALTTRISEEGQVVTEARYFLKSKGAPHLRLRLPEGSDLWSVTVDGATVVPVKDERGNLIPLPNRADPNVVTEVQAKVASHAKSARRLTVSAPVVSASVLLGEWVLEPAASRRLVYRGGTLTPAGGVVDRSGFAGLSRLFGAGFRDQTVGSLFVFLGALAVAAAVWSGRLGVGRRLGFRHLLSGLVGLAAAVLAVTTTLRLREQAAEVVVPAPPALHFVAPVQQGDVAWQVEVANVPREAGGGGWVVPVLLAAAACAAWGYGWLTSRTWLRRPASALGWTLLFWAALRVPGGAVAFFNVVLAFALLQLLLPALRRWWTSAPMGPSTPAMPATATLLGVFSAGVIALSGPPTQAQPAGQVSKPVAEVPVVAESVVHQVRVQDDFVTGIARVRWQARQGAALPVFVEPGVLLRSGHPTNAVRLVQLVREGRRTHLLIAERDGWIEFPLEYQARVATRESERGFLLPVPSGLVHRAVVTLLGLDVDVVSPQAVSAVRETSEVATNTLATLVLAPASDTWIGWRPRTRDTRQEKAVFYAEFAQLFVPGPGVIEGLHLVQVRPAQGELAELTFDVPPGLTISDVVAPGLSLWRFDPDGGRLRVDLSPAQSRPFALQVKSQAATTPLPFERSVGLLRVAGAAGQVGTVGVATGPEVQLDEAQAAGFPAINLEDFPPALVESLRAQTPGLTLRRAFRHVAAEGSLMLKASAVEPDVRVEGQQTLSLGEDRTVLAATLDVEVLRAGIFRLSFPLPAGLDVESLTGEALSHWTELKTGDDRTITLHLKGRTEGRHRFQVTLTGAGVRSTQGWAVPRLALREASKQRGQLLVVPEQGLRLQVALREGLTQLDPLQAGIREKGVLAFRLLQDAWTLALDLERVDAWIQVTGLQHVALTEAQVRSTANLQYEIENTGVKSLVVRLPAAAENVRFHGDHLSDFLARPAADGAATKEWEVKLDRRVIGRYVLQAVYTLPLAEGAAEVVIDGIQAQDVNLQRGFVTVQAGGRLQARIDPPPAVQATDWQVIPRALQQNIEATSADYSFRLVDPAFRLPIRLVRHEAARLLPARVNSVTLTSVVSDDGAVLTQVRVQMIPGDKRLLALTLPPKARFWFAFVNQNSVWPWQSTNQILIPLEQNSRTTDEATVEFFYTASAGQAGRRSLELSLSGPRFDLPLESIVWNLFLSEKWRLTDWRGSLQFRDEAVEVRPTVLDLDSYVRNEARMRQEQTRQAEQALNLANSLLEQGDPARARRALRSAYGMSQHDQAFNEDARVQLNNLKLQQALVGLNVRQARVAGGSGALEAAPAGLRDNRVANYTQSEARQLIERNTADETAAQQRLAERLIQQQEAATASPAAIRATLPEQGRRLTFTRPLEINPWSDLHLEVEAVAAGGVSGGWKLAVLAAAFLAAAALGAIPRRPPADAGP